MSVLLRRPTRILCFYCQTQVDPLNPRSFRCPACQCWNRYDANNEIISDEPAMHDENLNARSFAKRASPRTDRLPTMYGKGVFCHTCQTNQMLLSNLLSNYIPPVDDPDYTKRLQSFPAYRESIEIRYPPVCSQCQPAVDEEIRKRDQMARTSALGAFLKDSRGKGKRRQVSVNHAQKERFQRALIAWRIRGGLWVVTLLVSLCSHLAVALDHRFATIPRSLTPAVPAIVALSLLWTAWDPTFATMKRHQIQGRSVRQRGKREYNILQSLAWLSRLITSILFALPFLKPSWNTTLMQNPTTPTTRTYCYAVLALETFILIRSLMILRVDRPPPVHLLNSKPPYRPSSLSPPPLSKSPSSQGMNPHAEPDLLASLTLSNQPVLPSSSGTSNPIFGLPSLTARINHPTNGDISHYDMDEDADDDDREEDEEGERERDPNAMDWTPTTSPAKLKAKNQGTTDNNSNSWLRPQRFFAPEEPTGLETLFARTISLSDIGDEHSSRDGKKGEGPRGVGGQRRYEARQPWYWGAVLGVALIPLLVAVAFKFWERKKETWVAVDESDSYF